MQRKRIGHVADDSDDDDDDDDGYDVTEKGRTTFSDAEGVTAGKRSCPTDRDGDRRPRSRDVTSLDDFRFRCSAASTYNKPVTNGMIVQHRRSC